LTYIKVASAIAPQSGDIRRNPSCLIFGEQLGRRPPSRLFLEINIRKLLSRAVLHDEGGTNIFDCPRRREAAAWHKPKINFAYWRIS